MTSKLARASAAADPALASAARVLALEADSIRTLAESLDGAFAAAVDRIDSLTAAVPVFAVLLWAAGWGTL